MTFENLSEQADCNCLEGAVENHTSKFVIKTNRPSLILNDFKTKWEKGDTNVDTCQKKCGKKGNSMSKIHEEDTNLEDVISIYKILFPFSPSYKPYCTVFKLGENSGVVKSTPSNRNNYHHDFYKCDEFQLDSINYIESISLAV